MPATMLSLPQVAQRELTPWEPEQIGAFLDAASGNRLGPVFELATFTGLRRGELCGLRWADVDLEAQRIVVRHNRTLAGGTVLESDPKTRAGRRSLDLDDASVGVLMAWRLTQDAVAAAAGDAWVASGYVFTKEDGQPLNPAYVTRLFRTLRKAA